MDISVDGMVNAVAEATVLRVLVRIMLKLLSFLRKALISLTAANS